mgnify:CR=1|tara:strand:- start:290 stop:457 length:168 start_codon:yes stop_codon:yes gene_type:complete
MELKLDKTTKVLLGAIALGLLLNAIPSVQAAMDLQDYKMVKNGLATIASAIRGCN